MIYRSPLCDLSVVVVECSFNQFVFLYQVVKGSLSDVVVPNPSEKLLDAHCNRTFEAASHLIGGVVRLSLASLRSVSLRR